MSKSRLHTFTGRGFDPFSPKPADVHLEDIAHALSNTCRFGGHSPRFYSVAQHATLVAVLVLEASRRPDWALLALHHDSAEAYLGDIPRPIKQGMVFALEAREKGLTDDGLVYLPFELAEVRIYHAIIQGLELLDDDQAHASIKDADNAMLISELRGLFGERPDIHTGTTSMHCQPLPPGLCLGPDDAKTAFLRLHADLLSEMGCRGRN